MKTLPLSIIAILVVVLVISGNAVVAQSETTPSPLKQFKSGIATHYIKCEEGLYLIIKAGDSSPACVKIETGKELVKRGWATTFGTGISTNEYYTTCDTPYPQSNTGVAVLYMPVNSIGKICVRYSNFNDFPAPLGIRASNANNMNQNATGITTWSDFENNTIPKGNSTIVYWIKTGNQTGFYGLTIFCSGMPFAVGYNNQSNITVNDFPWVNKIFACPLMSYQYNIVGLSNIGIKYIPNQ